MSVRTGIQWAHHTHSPWTGCTRVSDGCTNCYAEALSRRFSDTFGAWGPSALRKRASDASVRAVRAWDRAAARAGERRRVFPSMCDPFDKQAPSSWRREFFALIDACPNLDFLLLTKRPQNIGKSDTLSNLPNVWLGVTAENQREADRRIPLLQEIPATIRFVCIEPMLSPVRLDLRGISWVIVGGESGPRARHMPADWARDVRDQCRTAGVPLFVKQMSRREPIPDDLMVREFPA